MIFIASILGAPDRVPAGKLEANAENISSRSSIIPAISEEICWTCEYFLISIRFRTLTVPNLETLPKSFLCRSTNILCSAISLASFSNSLANLRSSILLAPLFVVPANGKVSISPFLSLKSSSGEAPIIT